MCQNLSQIRRIVSFNFLFYNKKFKVVCFTLLAASAIASTFYFTTAKAANSKNPDTIIETEEASTEEQPSILPQNDRPSKVGS